MPSRRCFLDSVATGIFVLTRDASFVVEMSNDCYHFEMSGTCECSSFPDRLSAQTNVESRSNHSEKLKSCG